MSPAYRYITWLGSGGEVVDQDFVERVRLAIYDTFASQGHAPSRHQIRDLAALDGAQIDEAEPIAT